MIDVTGKDVDDSYKRGILISALDPLTRAHTSQYHHVDTPYHMLRQKVLEFANNVSGATVPHGGASPMDIGMVQPGANAEEPTWRADAGALECEHCEDPAQDYLAAVQHGFEEEHLDPRTGYSLDLAMPSSRIAIEVDGPSHFLLPDGRGVRRPNGPTLLKRRLLAAAIWRVISVPFYEWNGFATANGQQTYLERAVAPLLG